LSMFAWAGQFPVWIDTDTDTLFHGDSGGGTNAISTGGVSGGSGWQVTPSANPVTAGYNLLQAYNAAVASGPSSANRAVVLASPGIYQMTNTLEWTNEYVDLRCVSGKRDIHLTGSNIQFTADNIEIAHIDVTGTTDGYLYMGDDKPGQVFRNVKGGDWPTWPAWWEDKEFAGEIYDSEVGDRFGYRGTVSGTVSGNTIGGKFGFHGTVSGTVSGNTIGSGFGLYGTVSGTVSDNTIGDYFGHFGTVSGTVLRNTIGDYFGYDGTVSGTVSDNTIGDGFGYEFDYAGTVTGTILRNRFTGSYEPPTGSGKYIDCLDSDDRLFSLAATHDYSGATLYVAPGTVSSNPATMGQLTSASHTPVSLVSASNVEISGFSGWIQALQLTNSATISMASGSTATIDQIHFSLISGTNTVIWGQGIPANIAELVPSTNTTTTILFYSPWGQTNWIGTQL
jgi:hypothetical protein